MTTPMGSVVLPPDEEQNLVAQLTREVLIDAAPEELDLFASDELGWIHGSRTQAVTRDEMLGFGTQAATLLTPYVIAALTATVRYLSGFVTPATSSGQQAVDWIKGVFGVADVMPNPANVPANLRAAVRDVVSSTCQGMGLTAPDATIITDAVAGRIAPAP
ncbi:hypothetical protein [Mycolicibacterium sp.]|jgi:hypothetical protein|uniref:hypothetical protein n=1 Tax=Mycolicibacterium sp. TaxID=2320850 RepID=UPI0028AF2E35|nr:hypothetical protein [Mycolicibacterium sp.]